MKAIILGASGAVGSELVKLLEKDTEFEEVVMPLRRNIESPNPKMKSVKIDFDNPDSYKDLIKGDVLFLAFGTTIKKAGSKEAQYKIDFTYQKNIAKAAEENGLKTIVLVSSAGANPKSMFFYSRMKGELDEEIKKMNFDSVNILKPSVLDACREEERFGEKMAIKIGRAIKGFPLLGKYRAIKTSTVAKAMINLAKKQQKFVELELDDIFAEVE